ncbi:WhiB family transcriptional regulator [Kitasatospora sp. NPDC088548]|uniref:WhiB family transcriptional regulator n=1 Tax=Kitasatospora sp. NPDC088548 TaxID=3364075 RepID=UPI0038084758
MFPVDQFPNGICRKVDPEVMYPNPSDAEGIADAKEVCRFCEHRTDCFEAAMLLPAAKDFGVFGATTDDERKKLRRKAKRSAPTDRTADLALTS